MTVDLLVQSGSDGIASWQSVAPPLPPELVGFVRSWVGYVETTPGTHRSRELPGPHVVLIFEFGPPLRLSSRKNVACVVRRSRGFVAGLDDGWSYTEHDGVQCGIQVSLAPRGARAFFGLPLTELTRTVLDLNELLPGHSVFTERLEASPTWAQRFELVGRLLANRMAFGNVHRKVAWATSAIERSGGRIRVSSLTHDLGISRKQLRQDFLTHVGMPPKLYAEIVRFDRLTRLLRHSPGTPWATLAQELGFADQPHLAREVRRFAGLTPTELRRTVTGTFEGFCPEPNDAGTFLQDRA